MTTSIIIDSIVGLYNAVELGRYLTDNKHHYEPVSVVAAKGCKHVIKGTGVQKVIKKGYKKVKHMLT